MLEQTQGHCSDIFVTYYTCLSVSFVVLVLVFFCSKCPADSYWFKVRKITTTAKCEDCSKLIVKNPSSRHNES